MAVLTQMEDKVQRVRLRFKAMLAAADSAADRAALERPLGIPLSTSMLAAVKAMNRAGGFLEAVSIVLPELGSELIGEFEQYAAKVDRFSNLTPADAERREAGRREVSDRRGWDRRLGRDRRRLRLEVSVDRRVLADRRASGERRTGRIREVADRRLRAIHH